MMFRYLLLKGYTEYVFLHKHVTRNFININFILYIEYTNKSVFVINCHTIIKRR